MLLATIVVTYYPTEETLENITCYSANSEILYIWDNTPGGSPLLKGFSQGIMLNQSQENHGLAYAYNNAIRHCQASGCTHIMTMDQDSLFDGFAQYRKQIELFDDPSVGIFTCPINHDITEPGYRDTTVCQSGSVYTLKMLKEIGGFREDFFIGMVDAEMSLRALENGYKIYQFTGCNLIQHIGSGRIVQRFGKKITVSDYSPLRHYYDSRNRILLWHAFPYDFNLHQKIRHLWSRIKLMIKISLFENNKVGKIKAILRGTYHGLLNRTVPFQ